ncbi:hypothetical protein [Undibacterium sp. TS12]|uniref:hypothetical protein n=1 Tax=Undibacterium sp. TS12 TaxID=2908202 RepID=UPI001F4C7820|nr:hypothetical protein [Undibacterium sp. TS12]MCH8618691.1 hypothetical protein [Undibacterium sp. TS12]
MKTTWLLQLIKGMCLTAQGLASVWTSQASAVGVLAERTVPALATSTTTSAPNNSIIGHTAIDRTAANTNTQTNYKQSVASKFKDYIKPVSRIRRSDLQVAGAN